MSKFGWIIGDGMEELSFKRRETGWLFAAPFVWPRRRYIVTDEQKAQLGRRMRWMWRVQMLAIIIAVIFATAQGERQSALVQWLYLGVAVIVMFILSAIYAAIAIRPLLSGLTPTSERISRSDTFATQTSTYSTGVIVTFVATSLLLAAGSLLNGFTSGWDSFTILGVLLFGVLTVYFASLFIAKQRTKR